MTLNSNIFFLLAAFKLKIKKLEADSFTDNTNLFAHLEVHFEAAKPNTKA